MNSTDLVLQVIALFEQIQIPYMLVGSYSSNLYGRPRSTKDADFVVQISAAQVISLQQKLGPNFHLDPQMSFETITMTSRYIIHHPASTFKIEIFMLSSDLHDQARFARKQLVDFEGHLTWLPTPEDVIITKLRWSKGGKRAKDVDDVSRVLEVNAGKLDLPYIRHWCDQHDTRELFEKLLADAERFQRGLP